MAPEHYLLGLACSTPVDETPLVEPMPPDGLAWSARKPIAKPLYAGSNPVHLHSVPAAERWAQLFSFDMAMALSCAATVALPASFRSL